MILNLNLITYGSLANVTRDMSCTLFSRFESDITLAVHYPRISLPMKGTKLITLLYVCTYLFNLITQYVKYILPIEFFYVYNM